MKKLLLLLLIAPVLGFGQTFKDLMSISSLDIFKKVAIENDYTFIDEDDNGWLTYAIGYDGDDRADLWFSYNKNENRFSIASFKRYYKKIVKKIKKNCKYYDIVTYESSDGVIADYACYSCGELRGKIGFALSQDLNIIRHFPNN